MSATEQNFQIKLQTNTQITRAADLELGYACLLTDQSLISASGDDAASFLHNQLSNDVEHLKQGEARYAAYCTPKGRMLASIYYWKNGQDIVLQCSSTLQPALQKRLQMFVMRAKAKLEDVSDQFVILGLSGEGAQAFLMKYFTQLPSETNQATHNEAGTLIRRADAFDQARYQWVINKSAFDGIAVALQSDLRIVEPQIWRLGDIQAGIPEVREQTKEQFVPQMVNFELIGGVNFKKGCYPGQEIVARSQYLGKLKRRMAIAKVDTSTVLMATEVFSEDDPSQPCGMIVNAEQNFGDGSLCLVEIKLADQIESKVHLGSLTGPLLQFQTLPYAYLDITE